PHAVWLQPASCTGSRLPCLRPLAIAETLRCKLRCCLIRNPEKSVPMNAAVPPASAPSRTVNTRISPAGGSLDVLSREEVTRLRDASDSGLHSLLRRCALAVLTSGSLSDDPRGMQGQ